MVMEDEQLLSNEMIAKKKQEIESIDKAIESLQWEMQGEPYQQDDDYFEEMYLNSPETRLDSLFKEKEKLEEELFKDEYYRNIEKITKNSEYNSYKIAKLLTDDMPDIDMFNREAKAIQVAEEICDDSKGSLFNIGIVGEWGTGKSTLLNMIKKKLSKQKDVIEISYDASSYSEQNQIWANFAKILFERYEQEVLFP